jgi:hypothetical protein
MSLFGSLGDLAGGLLGMQQANKQTAFLNNAYSFNSSRPQYVQMLNELMKNPSSVTSMPGYQAGMDQAEQTVTRNMASQGLTGSGTAAKALADTGAQYEGTAFNNMFSMLSQLAGVNLNPAQGLSAMESIGQTKENSLSSIFSSLGGTDGSGGKGSGGLFDALSSIFL